MNNIEEQFLDVSKNELKDNFHLFKKCPAKILAYFRVYEIEQLDYVSNSEFKESKLRITDSLFEDEDLRYDIDYFLNNYQS